MRQFDDLVSGIVNECITPQLPTGAIHGHHVPAGLHALLAQFDMREICCESNTAITQRDVSSRLHGLRWIVIDDLVGVDHEWRTFLSCDAGSRAKHQGANARAPTDQPPREN